MPAFIDLKGKTFGRLSVLHRGPNSNGGMTRWMCRCDCGNTKLILAVSLSNQLTQSCGCLSRETTTKRNTTHGESKSSTYRSWRHAHDRCENPNDKSYRYYGAIGIRVCKRWTKFENFLEDMGECPSNFSLERIDVKKGYNPTNCIWVHKSHQARNRKNCIFITSNGIRASLKMWSKLTGIHYDTLTRRKREGWDDNAIVNTPYNRGKKKVADAPEEEPVKPPKKKSKAKA